jgi:hypothetical protein
MKRLTVAQVRLDGLNWYTFLATPFCSEKVLGYNVLLIVIAKHQ